MVMLNSIDNSKFSKGFVSEVGFAWDIQFVEGILFQDKIFVNYWELFQSSLNCLCKTN